MEFYPYKRRGGEHFLFRLKVEVGVKFLSYNSLSLHSSYFHHYKLYLSTVEN